MNDDEFRHAMATLDSYNGQLESFNRQMKLLQMSLEESSRARDSLKAIGEAKEGDEILVPVGASSFVKVKVTGEKKAIVGIRNNISVEKNIDDAVTFMESTISEISNALKSVTEATIKLEEIVTNLTLAVQGEYEIRQSQQ